MENLQIYGEMQLESGRLADEVVKTLIDKGFLIARTGCDQTKTWYEISKEKQLNQTFIGE